MRKSLVASIVLGSLFAGSAFADGPMIPGQVTKVDEAQGKMTIEHGPIKKFDMDAMTMVFRAGDPTMLKAIRPGDKVQFHVEKLNGAFTVTKIEKTK